MFMNFKICLLLCMFHQKECVETMKRMEQKLHVNIEYIKCCYLFSALTHMEITKVLIREEQGDLSSLISSLSSYNDNVRKQISSLFYTFTGDIGALWLLNIYLSVVCLYGNSNEKVEKITKEIYEYESIIKTHVYIMKKLQIECKKCNEPNIFKTNYMESLKSQKYPKAILSDMIVKNRRKMSNFLTENDRPDCLPIMNVEAFFKTIMFMKDVASNTEGIKCFKENYCVQVKWGNHIEKTLKSWYEAAANTLNWPYDNLLFIKDFYGKLFDFLKIIMLRLTWKHFLYLQNQKAEYVEYFANEWLAILQDFSHLTCVEIDTVINKIIFSINNFIIDMPKNEEGLIDDDEFPNYNQKYFDRLLSELKPTLEKLCAPFGCTATEPMVLLGDELPNHPDKPPHKPIDFSTVEHYSLLNARKFLEKIVARAKRADFDVMRSFIKYINKLNE